MITNNTELKILNRKGAELNEKKMGIWTQCLSLIGRMIWLVYTKVQQL